MSQACGASRWAYNHLLFLVRREYEAFLESQGLLAEMSKPWSEMTRKERIARSREVEAASKERRKKRIKIETPTSINQASFYKIISTKRNEGDPPWLKEVYSGVFSYACKHLYRAFKNWWDPKLPAGAPRPKKKYSQDSFTVQVKNHAIHPKRGKNTSRSGYVTVPGIGRTRVKLENPAQIIPQSVELCELTVMRVGRRWFASLAARNVPGPARLPQKTELVGLDLGTRSFLTVSTGEKVEPPEPLKRGLHTLARLQRAHARKTNGSRRHARSRNRVAEWHRHIADQRKDFHHKLANRLLADNATIVVEGFNIHDLVSTGVEMETRQAESLTKRTMLDMGWGRFREILQYKAGWLGREVVVLPRDVKTNITCHKCGKENPENKKKPQYVCECGVDVPRQLNTALLLVRLSRKRETTGADPGSEAREALS